MELNSTIIQHELEHRCPFCSNIFTFFINEKKLSDPFFNISCPVCFYMEIKSTDLINEVINKKIKDNESCEN